MSQKLDNLEVTSSMIIGAGINYLLTLYFFGVSYGFATFTTLVFFASSYLRSYIVRRVFRKIEQRKIRKENENQKLSN